MRKLLCLILALLLLPCAALAEATDPIVYTHPVHGYSFIMPADWTIIDSATFDSVLEAAGNGEIPGITSDFVSQYATQIQTQEMMIAVSADGMNNLNSIASDLGYGFSLEEVVSMICPNVVSQYNTQFAGCDIDDTGSVVTVGERDFARLTLSYAPFDGITLRLHQYIVMDNTIMYCLTFTNTALGEALSQEEMEALYAPILESLVLPGEADA